MFAGISSSLSGLAAAQTKINTVAHNIANSQTPDFKKTRTIFEESISGGVHVTLDQTQGSGLSAAITVSDNANEQELSNVHLEEEMVSLLIGKRSFEANVRAIDLQDETLGSLLDIIE